jgi:hypothetical protein
MFSSALALQKERAGVFIVVERKTKLEKHCKKETCQARFCSKDQVNETEGGRGIVCSLLKPIIGAGSQTDVTAKRMQLEVLPTMKTFVKKKSERVRCQWLHRSSIELACTGSMPRVE